MSATDVVLAAVIDQGNGYPDVGDFVRDDAGNLYEITESGDRITTGDPRGNACHGYVVEPADWSDLAEWEEPFPCLLILPTRKLKG